MKKNSLLFFLVILSLLLTIFSSHAEVSILEKEDEEAIMATNSFTEEHMEHILNIHNDIRSHFSSQGLDILHQETFVISKGPNHTVHVKSFTSNGEAHMHTSVISETKNLNPFHWTPYHWGKTTTYSTPTAPNDVGIFDKNIEKARNKKGVVSNIDIKGIKSRNDLLADRTKLEAQLKGKKNSLELHNIKGYDTDNTQGLRNDITKIQADINDVNLKIEKIPSQTKDAHKKAEQDIQATINNYTQLIGNSQEDYKNNFNRQQIKLAAAIDGLTQSIARSEETIKSIEINLNSPNKEIRNNAKAHKRTLEKKISDAKKKLADTELAFKNNANDTSSNYQKIKEKINNLKKIKFESNFDHHQDNAMPRNSKADKKVSYKRKSNVVTSGDGS